MRHTIKHTWYKEQELPNGEVEELEKESTYSFWMNWEDCEPEELTLEDGDEVDSEEELLNAIDEELDSLQTSEDDYYRELMEEERRANRYSFYLN